jgi:hypothetical protein
LFLGFFKSRDGLRICYLNEELGEVVILVVEFVGTLNKYVFSV